MPKINIVWPLADSKQATLIKRIPPLKAALSGEARY
jgi:hypothetical protein